MLLDRQVTRMNATEELLDQLSIKVKEVAGSDTPVGAPSAVDELLSRIDAAEESAGGQQGYESHRSISYL